MTGTGGVPERGRGMGPGALAAGAIVLLVVAAATYLVVMAGEPETVVIGQVAETGSGAPAMASPAAESAAPAIPEMTLTERQARGRTLYEANCQNCHGATGAGNGPLAASLPVQPVNVLLHLDHHLDEELVRIVTGGLPPAMPPIAMAAEDVLATFDYLRALADALDRAGLLPTGPVPMTGTMPMGQMPMPEGMPMPGMPMEGMPMGQGMPSGGGSAPAEP